MKTTEQAHSAWNARERIKRAMNSRGQRQNFYQPGDLVYYWRKQLPKSMNATKTGGFLGPGRVLVTETKREADGQLRAGSTIWIVRGRRLLKCSVEQLRPATDREHLLEHITVDENKTAPWTIPRMVEGLGKHEYEDVTSETPSLQEWQQGQEEEEQPMGEEPTLKRTEEDAELEAPRTRHRQKRAVEPKRGAGVEDRPRKAVHRQALKPKHGGLQWNSLSQKLRLWPTGRIKMQRLRWPLTCLPPREDGRLWRPT